MNRQLLNGGLASKPSALQQILSASRSLMSQARQPGVLPSTHSAPADAQPHAAHLQASHAHCSPAAGPCNALTLPNQALAGLQRLPAQPQPMHMLESPLPGTPLKQPEVQQQPTHPAAAAPLSHLQAPKRPTLLQQAPARSTAAPPAPHLQLLDRQQSPPSGQVPPPTPAAAAGAGGPTTPLQYCWRSVQRASCKKGCKGPILQSIKRMGRLGKKPPPHSGQSRRSLAMYKEPNCMYLSIDEAATHVGARTFRSACRTF